LALHDQVGFNVKVGRIGAFMSQPERDDFRRDSSLEQRRGGGYGLLCDSNRPGYRRIAWPLARYLIGGPHPKALDAGQTRRGSLWAPSPRRLRHKAMAKSRFPVACVRSKAFKKRCRSGSESASGRGRGGRDSTHGERVRTQALNTPPLFLPPHFPANEKHYRTRKPTSA
jgi:hypothetical protein